MANPSFEEMMAHNLRVIYPIVKNIYEDFVHRDTGMSADETARMVIEEFFLAKGLDPVINKGLSQALYALLRVEKLTLDDFTIIITKDENGNIISGDYTMPDWVPDEYAGKSIIQEMAEQEMKREAEDDDAQPVRFEAWVVGKTAPGEFGRKFRGCADGATMLVDKLGRLTLVLHMEAPDRTEILSCKQHKIETAYYAEGPFWLGQIRFVENKKLSFDFSLDITTGGKEGRQELIEKIKRNNVLLVVLIDTRYAKLMSFRAVSMPPAFHEGLYLSLAEQPGIKNFSVKYEDWNNKIYMEYESNELWRMSRRSGVMGETPTNWQEKY